MSIWEGTRLVLVGHRGTRRGENTVAAFEQALDGGVRAIELDVRLCATGEVVVCHDLDVSRATGGADKRAVRDIPYVELASMDFFETGQGAPLLRDVLLLAAARDAGVNVEVKYDDVDARALVRGVVRELDRGDFDVLVSSFDPRLLARVKAWRPVVRIALLTTPKRRWSLPLGRAAAGAFHAVHLDRAQVTPHLVRALKRKARVGVFTVNDASEAERLRELGVDWIITDDAAAMNVELG